MRVLQLLTYYTPNLSGLTVYVERLSRGLAMAGHDVTVLTSQFDPDLPLQEICDGVKIVRVPVAFRVSKGVVMPSYGRKVRALLGQHDIAHLHLPQFDGAGLALNARLRGKPSLLTYHCDILLPKGLINGVAQPVVHTMNYIAARLVNRIVAYTDDYAKHSPLLSRYMSKLTVIPPPVEMVTPTAEDIAAVARKWHMDAGRPVIGAVARLATEKGVEVLVKALEIVLKTHPNAQVFFAGPYKNVLGEAEYAERIHALVNQLNQNGTHWTFMGPLHGRELAAFYANCDVTVLPSLNSTESFGLVQVESMLNGTPSICSALPGVRVSVQTTGMGKVVPIGDAPALAQAIIEVTNNRAAYVKPRAFIESHYSTHKSVRMYEELYRSLIG